MSFSKTVISLYEDDSYFKTELIKRGISIFAFEDPSNTINGDNDIISCHIFDATHYDVTHQNIELVDFILIYNCMKSNLPPILSTCPNQNIVAVKDKNTCLEYLYFFTTYVAYLSLMAMEPVTDFQCICQKDSPEFRILSCIDITEAHNLAQDVECIFNQVEPNLEYSFFEYMDENYDKLSKFESLLGYGLTLAENCTRSKKMFFFEKYYFD